jgi:hypothetical protein
MANDPLSGVLSSMPGQRRPRKSLARGGPSLGTVPVRHRADHDRLVHFFGCVAATRHKFPPESG